MGKWDGCLWGHLRLVGMTAKLKTLRCFQLCKFWCSPVNLQYLARRDYMTIWRTRGEIRKQTWKGSSSLVAQWPLLGDAFQGRNRDGGVLTVKGSFKLAFRHNISWNRAFSFPFQFNLSGYWESRRSGDKKKKWGSSFHQCRGCCWVGVASTLRILLACRCGKSRLWTTEGGEQIAELWFLILRWWITRIYFSVREKFPENLLWVLGCHLFQSQEGPSIFISLKAYSSPPL